MAKILVINAGSTSLKYALLSEDLEVSQKGVVKEIGTAVPDHGQAFQKILGEIDKSDIVAVGHRIVHGGDEFFNPVIVTEEVLQHLEKYNKLAPLHNPPGLAGIKASWQSLGQDIPNVAVFDTAYYQNLPDEARRYAIPEELAEKYHLRRYGFHGISHQSVAELAAEKLAKPLVELNLITVHLGGGSSMTAVRQGQAIDTSMGFTPLEGLIMMTRSGDIDPALPLYVQAEAGKSADEIYNLLNKQSGMVALSGIHDGMEQIIEAYEQGDSASEKTRN